MIRLPDFVVDIIDPAGRYMRHGSPRPRRNLPRQFAAYTPVGAKPRTLDPEERQRLLAARARREPIPFDENGIVADGSTATAAAELAAHGHATVRARDARLVRFWHGDAILELSYPGGRRESRIPRRALRDPSSLRAELAKHLRTMIR